MTDKKCGDCIHADECERTPQLTAFSRDNIAYCRWFADKRKWTEVVRCEDCKYAMDMMPIQNSGCLMGECILRKEDDIVFTAFGDDFCSYGERRTDD